MKMNTNPRHDIFDVFDETFAVRSSTSSSACSWIVEQTYGRQGLEVLVAMNIMQTRMRIKNTKSLLERSVMPLPKSNLF